MSRLLVLLGALVLPALNALAQAPDLAAIAARCAPTLTEETVPRDERRQQILAGYYEKRFSYTLAQVPYETDLIAECYADGRLTRRYHLATALHFEKPEYGQGTLSLGWNDARRELTLVNDNGFGLWNRWLTLSPDLISSPFVVVGAEKPRGELRDTIDDIGVKELTVYPVIGLLGATASRPAHKTHFKLENTADFLAQASADGVRECVIVYLFAGFGGNPPFPFDPVYARSLPIN